MDQDLIGFLEMVDVQRVERFVDVSDEIANALDKFTREYPDRELRRDSEKIINRLRQISDNGI